MKLGNTSQSRVPVPDFFLNQTVKKMETFEVPERKRYFREKDLFRLTKDLNFCNHPRNFNRKHENFNKEKYIPDLTNINSILKNDSNNNENNKKFLNSIISPKGNSYENFRGFMEKTNVTNFTNPDLRGEIRENLEILINKINDKFDLDKWASIDTRVNFLQQTSSQCDYKTKTYFGSTNKDPDFSNFNNHSKENFKNNFSPKSFLVNKSAKKFDDTDERKFKTILRDKVNTMSIGKQLKIKLVKNFDKFGESTSDKFYKTKASKIIENFESYKTPKNSDINSFNCKDEINGNENSSKDKDAKKINSSIQDKIKMSNSVDFNFHFKNNNRDYIKNYNNTNKNSNHIKYTYLDGPQNRTNNNKKRFSHTSNDYNPKELNDVNDDFNVGKLTLPVVTSKYSDVNSDFYGNQSEVQKLRKENEKLYGRFKNTSLYRDFPSPDRKEFVIKKGEKLRVKNKKDKVDRTLLNFSNYNANKHKNVFCEDYDTNESVMVKFKKSKEVF